MKQSFFDKHFETIFGSILVGTLILIFAGIPISHWYSAGVEQKAINSECGTNYSQLDVMLSGKNLTELCRIKNQELLLKQK
jgi:hypothetical protein